MHVQPTGKRMGKLQLAFTSLKNALHLSKHPARHPLGRPRGPWRVNFDLQVEAAITDAQMNPNRKSVTLGSGKRVSFLVASEALQRIGRRISNEKFDEIDRMETVSSPASYQEVNRRVTLILGLISHSAIVIRNSRNPEERGDELLKMQRLVSEIKEIRLHGLPLSLRKPEREQEDGGGKNEVMPDQVLPITTETSKGPVIWKAPRPISLLMLKKTVLLEGVGEIPYGKAARLLEHRHDRLLRGSIPQPGFVELLTRYDKEFNTTQISSPSMKKKRKALAEMQRLFSAMMELGGKEPSEGWPVLKEYASRQKVQAA